MSKKSKLRVFLYRASKEPEKLDEPKYDASRGAIRLGLRDVGIDPRTGAAIMDSGEVGSHGDDFRSVQDMITDGDLDPLSLTLLARHYEAHPRRFVHYDG